VIATARARDGRTVTDDASVCALERNRRTQKVSLDRLVRSQHYQTEVGSPRDRFGATVSIELGEDCRDMELGGVDRDS